MKIRKSEGDKAFTEYKNQLSLAKSDADKMQSEYTDAKSANEEALKKLDDAKKLLEEVKAKKADWDRKIADLGGLDTIKQELVNLAAQKATNAATIQQRDATISLNLQKKPLPTRLPPMLQPLKLPLLPSKKHLRKKLQMLLRLKLMLLQKPRSLLMRYLQKKLRPKKLKSLKLRPS